MVYELRLINASKVVKISCTDDSFSYIFVFGSGNHLSEKNSRLFAFSGKAEKCLFTCKNGKYIL